MTTSLATLEAKLQTDIGDTNGAYADKYEDALKNAVTETYPNLFLPVDDTSLETTSGTYKYELPSDPDLQNGTVCQVQIRISGEEDDFTDAIWSTVYGWEIVDDGTTRYVRLPYNYASEKTIRLIGYCPLETLASDTPISLEGEQLNLLTAYAGYWLYEKEANVASSEDRGRYEEISAKWLGKYYRLLPFKRMTKPRMTLGIRV